MDEMGHSDAPLRVAVADGPLGLVVTVAGELDLDTAPRLVERVEQAVPADPEALLLLDVRGLDYIDSSGLRALLRFSEVTGGRLALVAPARAVLRALEITRLDECIPTIPDLEAATLTRLRQRLPDLRSRAG